MKQHKRNKPMLYEQVLQLMLITILCVGCLSIAVGTTYARYRSESEEGLLFEMRQPDQVSLGTIQKVQDEDTFVLSDTLNWTIDEKDGLASLTFAVANGSDGKNYSFKDQLVRLRMIGSLSIAESGKIPALTVTYVSEKLNGEKIEKTVQGEVSSIMEGSPLYHTHGHGFLYTFYETTPEGKKELTWELPGEKLSYFTLTVKTTEEVSGTLGFLQPLVVAETIEN